MTARDGQCPAPQNPQQSPHAPSWQPGTGNALRPHRPSPSPPQGSPGGEGLGLKGTAVREQRSPGPRGGKTEVAPSHLCVNPLRGPRPQPGAGAASVLLPLTPCLASLGDSGLHGGKSQAWPGDDEDSEWALLGLPSPPPPAPPRRVETSQSLASPPVSTGGWGQDGECSLKHPSSTPTGGEG